MLELSILGFLFERPMHAYELRQRISGLSGHIRPVSDGALYPALNRLRAAGLITKQHDADTGRQLLELTQTGRADLLRRLRDPAPVEITDRNNFLILLAFLGHLPDRSDQIAVLRRRLDFYEQPASYFYEQGRPLKAVEMTDRFRRGMLTLAAATRKADKEWLSAQIAELEADS
ncbi:PadR family transcriptional regulator [Nocardia pseudobrasiliensis]|uniref:PadR family transcriptional regulator n=1 Tax=Nocardia pseudobrasiliensis TaxID=45979 RepID=A0A370I923_9NOCA|nr:PadR family transcriptional regulator [Nocardia pseudobrasiliensis]RDI67198.1 PadR family transcriptional regulator [Nocardia pseudobrasiliensis]